MLCAEAQPALAVRSPDDKVIFAKAKSKHGINGHGNELSIGACGCLSDDVGIKLNEFTAATFLWFLVAETGADLEPFERFRKVALIGSDNTCE